MTIELLLTLILMNLGHEPIRYYPDKQQHRSPKPRNIRRSINIPPNTKHRA